MLADLFFGKRASDQGLAGLLSNPTKWLIEWAQGGPSAAGVPVNEDKVIGIAVAYACVSLIAKTIATLPVHGYERKGKLSELVPDDEFAGLMSEAPNPLMTGVTWREVMIAHALLWGNHYSFIDVGPRGDVMLLPFAPYNVRVELTSDGRRKKYLVKTPDGSEREFREDQIFHVPGLSFDGLVGISPVRKLRNTYGLSLATEAFGSKFFANDARPGVIVETPAKMKPEASKNLIESLYAKYTGVENAWKVMVLEEGAKMHMVQMPLEDAQFLDTQKLQDTRICGIFGAPPHLVGIVDKSTSWGTGIEQQNIGYATHTIRPWCVKIEAEAKRKFYQGSARFLRFNLDGLQRGDYKSRMDGHAVAVQHGLKLIDEIRELEDDPPLPDGLGRIPMFPANMSTIDNLQKPRAEPAAAPADPKEDPAKEGQT